MGGKKYIDSRAQIIIKGQPLPNLGSEGRVKYLGIHYSCSGIVRDAGLKIDAQLEELKKARSNHIRG